MTRPICPALFRLRAASLRRHPKQSCFRRSRVLRLFAWVAVIALAERPVSAEDDEAFIRALGEAYLSNRDSFLFFSTTFTIATGTARNVDDAVRRGPIRDVVKASGLWVHDGDLDRYELTRDLRSGPPAELMNNGKQMGIKLPPITIVRGKDMALSLSGVLRGGGVGLLKDVSHHLPYTAWNLVGECGSTDTLNLGDMVANYLGTGQATFTLVRRDARVGNLPSVEIVFADNGSGRVFFVDDAAGCIPREVWLVRKGAVVRKVFVGEVRKCAGGRFFPMRVASVAVPSSSVDGVSVRELRTTTLDVDARPTIASLTVTVPADSFINDPTGEGEQYRLRDAQRVGYNDLPSLLSRSHEERARRKAAAENEGPSESSTWRAWLIVANVVLVLAVVVYLLRRRTA